jgi:hypothetical protein
MSNFENATSMLLAVLLVLALVLIIPVSIYLAWNGTIALFGWLPRISLLTSCGLAVVSVFGTLQLAAISASFSTAKKD